MTQVQTQLTESQRNQLLPSSHTEQENITAERN
jgi:hypothetical protein